MRGSDDGTGPAASFNTPYGIAADAAGNVYIADSANSIIRKITPAGVVSTLAGSRGVFLSADGTGSAASFNNPVGVAVDATGNVYVADTFNNTIRRVTQAGVVTTLAGTAGVRGSADGTGAAASFNNPVGIPVDGTGDLYVADELNQTIRKVTAAGVVTTVAGSAGLIGATNGTGPAARFSDPVEVTIDGSGNLYVSDQSNDTIRKITAAGVVTTLAGTAGLTGTADGTGATARFDHPVGIAIHGFGPLYVSDNRNNTIRKIT